MSARACFTFDGIGILVNAATLSALGLTPAEKIVCPRKSALVEPMLTLAVESLRLWTNVLEEGSDVVGCGVRIVDDDFVKVGGDAFQAFNDIVNHLDEPAGGGAAVLRHETSHSNSLSDVQKAARGIVSLSMMIWWKEETRSNMENTRPLPKEFWISSTRGKGSCPRELMALSFS